MCFGIYLSNLVWTSESVPPQTSVNYLKVSVVISLGFRGIGKEMGKSSPDAVPTIAERGSAEVPTLIPAESGLRKPTLSLKRKG
jgi:hypothetical protein